MKSQTAGMEVNLGWECSGRLQNGAPLAWPIAAWIRRAHVSVGDNGHHVGGSNHGGINSCLVLVRRLATLHKRDAEQIIQQDLERISFHRDSIWHRAATLSWRGKCKSYNTADLQPRWKNEVCDSGTLAPQCYLLDLTRELCVRPNQIMS